MTPWTVARQAPLSMGFSRQKYWSRLPIPTPGDFPDPGIKPTSLVSCTSGGFFTTSTTGEALVSMLKSESEVTQSCPTLCDPADCSPPGSSVHGILQARVLEWAAISLFSSVQFRRSVMPDSLRPHELQHA